MTAGAEPSAAVDLAHEPDFRLGALEVSPSAARVRFPGGERRVEPRVMEVLVALVRAGGRTVTRDELIEACWGGRIVSDDAVGRAVAQVRALARDVEPAPFSVETAPRIGFRLVVAPPGEARAAAAPPGAPPRPVVPSRRLWITAAAALSLLAAGGAGWFWLQPGPRGDVEVMRLQAPAADPALAGIGEQVSESVVRQLAGSGVRTARATAVSPDAGGGRAEFRVAGTVDRAGDKVVISPQILDRASGVVLWSGRYERAADAPVRPAEEAGVTVAGVLQCALEDRATRRRPLPMEAFALNLNACAAALESYDWQRSLRLARQLTAMVPDYAAGHGLRAVGAAIVARGAADAPELADPLRAEAQAELDRALQLNRREPKAYLARAVLAQLRHDWLARDRDLERALSLRPDYPPARGAYASFLREVGRQREAQAVAAAQNAAGDPRVGPGGDPRAVLLRAALGDVSGALDDLARLEESRQVNYDDIRWTIAFWWQPIETGLRLTRERRQEDERTTNACAIPYLTRLAARSPGGEALRGLPPACDAVTDGWRVRMLARQGDVDGAYAAWEALSPADRWSPLFLYYPEMRAFRADPRFLPLAAKLGLVDYWRRSGHWPDFCDAPDRPYDCRAAVAARRL